MASPPETAPDLPLNIIIMGASGDLSRKKILPALFALFARGFLPSRVRIFGYARTKMDDASFREKIAPELQCDDLSAGVCGTARTRFLACCHYHAGAYDSVSDLQALNRAIAEPAERASGHLLWYLALPPEVFPRAIETIGQAGLAQERAPAWTRVVVEKPFGRDRAGSDALIRRIRRVFTESQTFRIDHYLGKEVIQNLMVLRFANIVLEPVWNRRYVSHVHISWKEDLSLSGRGGYFDDIGIVRDVMQNHLTQILALTAMECPWDAGERYVGDEKVRLLDQVRPVTLEDIVIGQYTDGAVDGRPMPAYRDEPGVAPDSITPTYAAAVLHVMSPRWRGVPFLMSAGKGLDGRKTEIRLHFRPIEDGPFAGTSPPLPANEFTIRVQPEEDIRLGIVSKKPGFGMPLDNPHLNLNYRAAYPDRIADAYENLLLEVLRGDRSLFLRADELTAAWNIFTPALHALDKTHRRPESYAFGSKGPAGLRRLAERYRIEDPFS